MTVFAGSFLTVLSVLLVSNNAVINGCTSGFMELDLLMKRAEKIPNGDINENSLDGKFRLLDESFSCSGTMTGLLFVGLYRTDGGRNMYPEIQLWRNTGGNTYTKQASEEIQLTAGVFSPDGVLQYNLTTPMSFQSGDKLGVYQPAIGDSIVRVYYRSATATTYELGNNAPSTINLPDLSERSDELILISPVTGSSSCTGSFSSRSILTQGALDLNINDVLGKDRKQTLFPDITFTCNGFITKWILGAEALSNTLMPELQIWRNTGGTSYTKAGFSLLPSNTLTGTVAEYTLSTPLEFQEGDILGVYQPRRGDSALVVYYQERDGPVNYEEGNSVLSTVTLGNPDQYDYPLVTVEISSVPVTSSSILTSSVMSSQHCCDTTNVVATAVISTVTEMTSSYAASNSIFLTSSSIHSTAVIHQATASSTWLIQETAITSTIRVIATSTIPSSPTLMEQNVILFTAVPILLILFITIAILTISIILFIVCRRKSYNSSHTTKHPKYAEVELHQNECYASCKIDDKFEVDQKQDAIDLQHNEAYCTHLQVQQSNHQIQLQQNECYVAASRPAGAEMDKNAEYYSYADVGLRHSSAQQQNSVALKPPVPQATENDDGLYY